MEGVVLGVVVVVVVVVVGTCAVEACISAVDRCTLIVSVANHSIASVVRLGWVLGAPGAWILVLSVADAVWVHVIRIDAAHALALVVVHAIDERAFVSWLSRI